MQVAMTPKRPPIQGLGASYVAPNPNFSQNSFISNVNDNVYEVPEYPSPLLEIERRGEEMRTQKHEEPVVYYDEPQEEEPRVQYGPELPEGYFEEEEEEEEPRVQYGPQVPERYFADDEEEPVTKGIPQEEGTS
jgi:hypothetical protein